MHPTHDTTAPRTLADLAPGQAATVAALHSTGPVRRRMMDLGLLPGTRVVVEMSSPLGDPVAYRVRGAVVALRRAQAAQIDVRDIDTHSRPAEAVSAPASDDAAEHPPEGDR